MDCPKCGAKECFRSSAYAEWQCGSADDFGEFVEEDNCLRNQLTALRSQLEWREVTEINHSTRVLLVAPNGDMWVGSRTKGAMKLGCLWLPLPELPKEQE